MKVVILQNFEGYPGDPDKPGTHYVATRNPATDDEAIEVPDEFGALIVKKGHARAVGSSAAPAAPSPITPKAGDDQ